MSDYDPLDISQFCNVGTDILRGAPGDPRFFALLDDIEAPVGHQTFQGLPFIIGAEDGSRERSFIKFSSETSGVSIPVNKPANNIIFAHRLLESDLYVGGPLGKPIAEYVFHLENNSQIRVPIREKFEISSIMGFGGTPYWRFLTKKMYYSTVMKDRGKIWDAVKQKLPQAQLVTFCGHGKTLTQK